MLLPQCSTSCKDPHLLEFHRHNMNDIFHNKTNYIFLYVLLLYSEENNIDMQCIHAFVLILGSHHQCQTINLYMKIRISWFPMYPTLEIWKVFLHYIHIHLSEMSVQITHKYTSIIVIFWNSNYPTIHLVRVS